MTLVLALLCSALVAESPVKDQQLSLTWDKNFLSISGPKVPGRVIKVMYIEAYCRPGSTERSWNETVIGHRTKLIARSDDGRQVTLKCTLRDGVVVDHLITASKDKVTFRLTATNSTGRKSLAHWAQPCIQVAEFTGRTQRTYLEKCFVFIDGRLQRLPTRPWSTDARYTPGLVWAPKSIDRDDLNPRPISRLVPSNGLIGCFSADEKTILATAWEPYQELFQGVITCIHSDFRIGGLEPGETKTIRGTIYIVPADTQRLLQRYREDFPEHH